MGRLTKIGLLIVTVTGMLGLSAQPRGGMGRGMGMPDSSFMCGKMMMNMFSPSFASTTQDGGLIVIMGNKISKYDKNLNLRREVEMKVDTAAFMNMMRRCPAMGQQRPPADGVGEDTASDTMGAPDSVIR